MARKTKLDEENLQLKYLYNEDLYNDIDQDEVDITALRYTLLQCRRQLLIWIKRLIDTEYSYTKVELREDFDKLKMKFDNLTIETVFLRGSFQELTNQCKFLIDQTTDILAERDGYYTEWESNRNILTPRPDWDKCSHIMPNWKTLSIGKTSEELVDILINEIIHGNTIDNNNSGYFTMMIKKSNDSSQKTMFFDQLYANSSSEAKLIKNRHIRRRITGLLLKNIWSNKLYDEIQFENKKPIKLCDYVFDYLTERFNSKEIAIEMSYNIKDACTRYRNNYEINLFWQILTGQIEENVYHYEMKEYARILQYLIKLLPNLASLSFTSTMPWSDLTTALHELYPHWNDERISLLITCAKRDLKQSSIEKNEFEFLLLFTEDDEGRIGEFLTNIRQQLQLDKAEYIEKITELLIGNPIISINQFKQAIQFIDPRIPEMELQRYINWVFELDNVSITLHQQEVLSKSNKNMESMKSTLKRDFEDIIHRLEHCSCYMH